MTYRAFVSSTFDDLEQHRAHVIRALRKAGFYVDPMEDWSAATGEPKQFSQRRLVGCDLCILLVAFRRGHVPERETRSITQLEYDAARKLGIDVLVFMLDERAPWPRRFDELGVDPELGKWRRALLETTGVGRFDNDPLSVEVAPALARWLMEKRSPAPSRASGHVTIRSQGADGAVLFQGNAALVRFGRDPSSDVVVPHPASWEQGRILFTSGVYVYQHLGREPTVLRRRPDQSIELSRQGRVEETLHQLDELALPGSMVVSVSMRLPGDVGYTPTERG